MGTKKFLIGVGTFILGAVGTGFLFAMNSSSPCLSSLSDEELNEEREKVRLDFCASGNDFDRAVQLQKELYRYDDELLRRGKRSFEKNDTPHIPWTDENRWEND